jgi:hypothetical protein
MKHCIWIVSGSLVVVVLLFAVGGCNDAASDSDHSGNDQGKKGNSVNPVNPKTAAATGTGDVVFAIKDGKAMVLLDLQPEAGSLVKLAPAEREIHLLKRAFANLEHKTMAKSPYKDKDRCVVRMVMLTAIDQYNRPVWGSAVEIANFEIDLAKVRQTGKPASVLKQENVAEFFVSQTVNQANIKEYQVDRIKTN